VKLTISKKENIGNKEAEEPDYGEDIRNRKKISEMKSKGEEPAYNIFDRLVNQLCNKMPFGSTYDTTHILLTNAFMFSFGCGWLSQSMANRKEPKFKEEYLE
jgi:hypothetical protein